jgi:hypothetical protein
LRTVFAGVPPIRLFKKRWNVSQFVVVREIHDSVEDVVGHEVLWPEEIIARKFSFHLPSSPVV